MPSLEEIREIIKNNKTKAFDFEPIYENLIFFYLNYDYDGNKATDINQKRESKIKKLIKKRIEI